MLLHLSHLLGYSWFLSLAMRGILGFPLKMLVGGALWYIGICSAAVRLGSVGHPCALHILAHVSSLGTFRVNGATQSRVGTFPLCVCLHPCVHLGTDTGNILITRRQIVDLLSFQQISCMQSIGPALNLLVHPAPQTMQVVEVWFPTFGLLKYPAYADLCWMLLDGIETKGVGEVVSCMTAFYWCTFISFSRNSNICLHFHFPVFGSSHVSVNHRVILSSPRRLVIMLTASR